MQTTRVLKEAGRIINKNPYLYGPGPVMRKPSGLTSWYANQDPATGFAWAAAHGIILSLTGGLAYKYLVLDPEIKTIEDYYRENPPK